ncbi:MAG: efflux RND transporter permease subunit [Thermodesulfobacteriota bacterium]
MRNLLLELGLKRPWWIILVVLLGTIGFALQFPKVNFDNDPENMLAEDEPVRVFHNDIKHKYDLYDFVIVGIVNDENPHGVFNVSTLTRIDRLTQQLLYLQRGDNGLPSIDIPGKDSAPRRLDLAPDSRWESLLNIAFSHDPNNLFTPDGDSAIVAQEIISPSVVDNIKQAQLGSLKLEYLMENPPETQEQALQIRDDAMNNPLYRGTLVSEDEKAICLYIPIEKKHFSHNVANLVHHLTADWPEEDQIYITGLPVAEDTFGVEMLVQMATSAPMAGVAIAVLLWLFFRSISLIVAPMLVAIVSVVVTMGLLIGLGYDVHIMSSMIAIFLMPIAVADSVHILSEFYDVYPRFKDKAQSIRHVLAHLFKPMLYTSLTTMAGFASLAFTPIPPVQVFGLHVAFGVGLAWLLSMLLIPAYIMLFLNPARMKMPELHHAENTPLAKGLRRLGMVGYSASGRVLLVVLAVLLVAAYGISQIQVNDNPVKWFEPEHRIRVADRVLNEHFGGTYTAYLTFTQKRPAGRCDCTEKSEIIENRVQKQFADDFPSATRSFITTLEQISAEQQSVQGCNLDKCFYQLMREAERLDKQISSGWGMLADEINYMEVDGLAFAELKAQLEGLGAEVADERAILLEELQSSSDLEGAALMDTALDLCYARLDKSFANFVLDLQAELTAPPFKQPRVLRYVEDLQQHLNDNAQVGKVTSVVDALKKTSYELRYVAPPSDASNPELESYRERNNSNYAVPDSASAAGQIYVQLEGMKKKDSLFHMVTRDYAEANMWVQLKSGDNKDMEQVVAAVENYMHDNPPPLELKAEWAGLTYLNVVWQDKMVRGMLSSLGGSFIVVLVMMTLLFRSPLWGLLAMVPLSVTIASIYGIIGLVGKDYDMPVAVLSSLTLGLSVDFAIHFLQRAREMQREIGDWRQTCAAMFKEPAMAITRNAITVAVGFTPLLFAPLVPYQTVGFFLATIMVVSWLASLLVLSALLTRTQRWAFRPKLERQGW